jgi:hypothetical protein
MLQLGMTRQFNGSIRSGRYYVPSELGSLEFWQTNLRTATSSAILWHNAAPIAGFLTAAIRSHDLRRGAAQDAATLESKIKGHATDAVAEYLGYNDNKTTKRYIGSMRDSVYTMRVEENFQDPFNLAKTNSRYVKRRRLDPAVITEMCVR